MGKALIVNKLIWVLVGVLMTISIIIASSFMNFLPFGIKISLVETREFGISESKFDSDEGYVQDSKTAMKIAEAIWLNIYGEAIYEQKPFDAILEDDVWTVSGSLPKQSIGGTAVIEISKRDGRIIEVYHGK